MAKIKHATLIEQFEDTKWVIWSCKSKKDRQSFRLPIWYLQTLLSMSHFLFWPLHCLSFDLQLQITHLVSSNSSINVSLFTLAILLSVFLWLTASDYPFGISKIKNETLIEEFEDTKWVIWSCKSKKDRQ
jgi:hypothetical protein